MIRRRMSRTALGLALATSVASAASPGMTAEDEATLRAISAGYKAAFTCSATFNAGKSREQIAAHELTGLAPDYARFIEGLPEAEIDREAKLVSVAYLPGLPPRMAKWRPHLGCTQLPVGANAASADLLPAVNIDTSGLEMETDNGLPWTRHVPVGGSSGNAALDSVIARAFAAPNYGRDQFTTAILIARPEAIIAEHYIEGLTPTTSQRTWSVAKSIAASIIGVAVEKGIITVDAPAGLAAWSRPLDPRGAITLQNLLQMASGLDSDRAGNRTDRLYFGGGLVSDTATRTALEVRPGERWKYANNDTLLAIRALREKIGERDAYLRFPFENLLFPIGMTHTRLETDWDGNFVLSSQVWTTARDLARLGLLHLNDGVWNGQRLLPRGWVRYVSTPAPAQPAEPRPGYGAQWWLYNARFPELPDDAFAALGNRGQYLLVIPSENLVIVRRGHDPSGGQGFQLHDFARDVLAALGRGPGRN
jgi:CubicO group peptidase (beta-lactamase class C family)